jgi:phage terminase large subunit
LVIARKTLSSTYSTVLQTFRDKVLGADRTRWPCEAYGGEKPEWFNYRNGSRIWIAGMDKASKVLSAEHDIILAVQAEEFSLDDWETLTTRTTGRAGNMPYSQTLGDCNPAWPTHWIYNRPSLRIFYSQHSENPALFDQETGAITAQGERTMAVLQALTGVRRDRLLEGVPSRAEGVVYGTWDEKLHLKYAAAVPRLKRYVAGQDWGYTHPGVLGVWGLDWDDRMYLVAQIGIGLGRQNVPCGADIPHQGEHRLVDAAGGRVARRVWH